MYKIEEENSNIIQYINDINIYRIHPTIYIGFDKPVLYRTYRDTIWTYASEYIESLEQFQDQIYIVKNDENFRCKSFFLIKKSDKINKENKIWDCMVYVIKNEEDINIPSIISSSSPLIYC